MRVIIQIPCYNESSTLGAVIADLPRRLTGVDTIEVLVIDDGSTDNTAQLAASLGVDHVVRHQINRGIAAAFQTGIENAVRLGADIIVNTDGDHQYPGSEIERIVAPILAGEADLVVGDRQTHAVEHFSPVKKALQKSGSWFVGLAAGEKIPDAASGFRALSRDAAMRLTIFTTYSYTLETIIQASKKGLCIQYIPIHINSPTRTSRLVRSNWSYVWRQAITTLRIYTLYEPLKSFMLLSLPPLAAGLLLLARFAYFYLTNQTYQGRHVQSVVIGSLLITLGFLVFLFGVLADTNAINRRLLEDLLFQQRKTQSDGRISNTD